VIARLALTAVLVCASSIARAQTTDALNNATRSGAEIYRAGCIGCHGPDGTGQPKGIVGFSVELPDFADCETASVERRADWRSTIENGGRVRGFDRKMPAFKDAMTSSDIDKVVEYLRGFCRDRAWPDGDLNLPRPLVTEKAFPENEFVVTTTHERSHGSSTSSTFVYEHRLGARSQYEVAVPFDLQKTNGGSWSRGLGDIAVAFKHVLVSSLDTGSIVSAGAETLLPTGKESEGLGGGVTVFEPFVVFSQQLSESGFLHLHAGFERSLNHTVANDVSFLRAAIGRSFRQPHGGRMWSPMVELISERERTSGAQTEWDIVPQMQITLNRRKHIIVNAGLQIPVNERAGRNRKALVYFLWDWFDGGLLEGW
jgi:mono/diheme cytochrome c family protein